MEVVSCVVGIRVAIPPAFPGALGVRLSIMNLGIVVCVPPDSQDRPADSRWIVRRHECNMNFEVTTSVRDSRLFDLLCRSETRLEELEDQTIDGSRAPAIAC